MKIYLRYELPRQRVPCLECPCSIVTINELGKVDKIECECGEKINGKCSCEWVEKD